MAITKFFVANNSYVNYSFIITLYINIYIHYLSTTGIDNFLLIVYKNHLVILCYFLYKNLYK